MYQTATSNPVLAMLRATYKTLFITPVQAGREMGYEEKTTRNLLSAKTFPIKTEQLIEGGRPMVSIIKLADFISKKSGIQVQQQEQIQRRRGPRTKVERMQETGRVL